MLEKCIYTSRVYCIYMLCKQTCCCAENVLKLNLLYSSLNILKLPLNRTQYLTVWVLTSLLSPKNQQNSKKEERSCYDLFYHHNFLALRWWFAAILEILFWQQSIVSPTEISLSYVTIMEKLLIHLLKFLTDRYFHRFFHAFFVSKITEQRRL